MTESYGEAEQQIRAKLEASGELAKMRAMIVEAALRVLNSSSNSSSSSDSQSGTVTSNGEVSAHTVEGAPMQHPSAGTTAASSVFFPHPSLVAIKTHAQEQLVIAAVIDYLHSLGLQYTANMLRMEANLQDIHLPSSADLATALNVSEIVTHITDAAGDSHTNTTVLGAVIARARGLHHTDAHAPLHTSPALTLPVADVATTTAAKKSPTSGGLISPTLATTTTTTTTTTTAYEAQKRIGEQPDAHMESHTEEAKDTTESASESDAAGEDTTFFISQWTGKSFVRGDEIEGQQLQVEYLNNCNVSVLSAIDSMTLDDCSGGELIVAACEGSVFLRNCHDMTVHVACKQLRMRDCADMDVRLFTSTDPVIEMSHHISFRPFHLRLPHLRRSFQKARLNPSVNRFVHVYDFTKTVTTLPQPHATIHYPNHGLVMEDRVPVGRNQKPHEHYQSAPECPHEMEELLTGRLRPAASSETGENKSYDIATGAALWAAGATAEHAPPLTKTAGGESETEEEEEEEEDEDEDSSANEDTDTEDGTDDDDDDDETDETEESDTNDEDTDEDDDEEATDESESEQTAKTTVRQPQSGSPTSVRVVAEPLGHAPSASTPHTPPRSGKPPSPHGSSAVAPSVAGPTMVTTPGNPPAVRGGVARTVTTTHRDEDAYSSFDDTNSESEDKDEYAVDEDDDVF